MAEESYRLVVKAEDQAESGRSATALADIFRESDEVLEAVRGKVDDRTMDLGAVVSVVATSGATFALARGLAGWLRARRAVTVTIERGGKSGSVKVAVAGIDPEAAVRIVEIVRQD